MIKRFSMWLYRVSTGKITLICLIIFLLFSALVLPAQTTGADALGEDVGSPDLSFIQLKIYMIWLKVMAKRGVRHISERDSLST